MEKTRLRFDTNLKTIYSLFREHSFMIPPYQRKYSWDTEQWQQLWQDLENYKQENPEEHFLGPMIVTPSENKIADYEVIDGQQRLTTFQLILSIIRDSWILRGDPVTTQNGVSVQNRKLTEDLIHNLTPTVRHVFVPNRHLKEIFRDFVQIPVNEAMRKSFEDTEIFRSYKHAEQATELRRAFLYFHSRISELSDEDLKKLQNFILFKVLLLTIDAGESSNAYILFETLNYRGLELAQADLVKSFLFSKVFGDSDDERYIDVWDEIEGFLGNQSPDIFLRHYLLLNTEKVLKKDIYSEIRSRIGSREQVVEFIFDLKRYAQLYSYLMRESDFKGPHREVLNHLFSDLLRVGVETQYVYLLAIMDQFFSQDQDWDYSKIESAGRLSEALSFRWTICGGNAQELEGIYQRASSIIYKKADNLESAFKQAQKLLGDSLPSDEEFASALSNKIIKSNQRGHYILRKIDQWNNRDGAYILMGPSELQLEHVAPRKPSKSSGWESRLGEADYSDLVCRIGNMILLKKKPNREGSNKSFKEKIKIYQTLNKGIYPSLSQEILNYTDWTSETIQERSERISELALNVWSPNSKNIQGRAKPKARRKSKVSERKRKSVRKKTKTKSRKKSPSK